MGIIRKSDSQLENLSSVLSILPKSDYSANGISLDETGEGLFKQDRVQGLLIGPNGEIALETDNNIKGFVPLPAHKVSELFADRFGHSLTLAELQLLVYLMSGKSLSQISDILDRAYNTHRNQLAVIRDKSGISRQADLIQTMSVLATNHVLAKQSVDPVANNPLVGILSGHYKSGFRLHAPLLSNGRRLLVLDIGPTTGRRCVFFHASFYPVFPLPHQADLLEKWNVRVVIPLRPGYFLAPSASNDPDESLDAYSSDVAEFFEIFGLQNAPFISHTFGIYSLLEVAHKLNFELPRSIVSSPINLNQDLSGQPGSFRRSWAQMSYRFPNLLEPTLRTFSKHLISANVFISALENAYLDSPVDLELIRFSKGQGWYKDLLKQTALSNSLGVEMDLKLSGKSWMPKLMASPQQGENFEFILSENNPFSNYESIISDFESHGIRFETLANSGQNSPLYQAEFLLGRAFSES